MASEAMTEERLAQLRRAASLEPELPSEVAMRELVAEVDRLRLSLAASEALVGALVAALPRCTMPGCSATAVRQYPTAELGYYVSRCDAHAGAENSDEFGFDAHPRDLPWAAAIWKVGAGKIGGAE